MLKDEVEKKSSTKRQKKLESTGLTRKLSHETEITS
jgi:hypothetical protein